MAPIVITVLAYLHIVSAIGWLGGAILFVSVLAPGLRSLSPTASMEFLSKVGPRATTFFIGTSTATVVFGLGLLYADLSVLSAGISVGLTLGLIAYLDAILVAVPGFRKADRLAKEKLASVQAGPPSLELMKALRRGGIGVTTVVMLLIVTLMFMVASGFPF